MSVNKNIILDLDETLVHTFGVKLPTGKEGRNLMQQHHGRIYIVNSVTLNNQKKIKNEYLWGITRPGLNKFMQFCFNQFGQVIIWSAGTGRYVKDVVNKVLCDLRCPHYIFTQEDCYVDDEGYLKKPIKYLKSENPEINNLYLENTLIIDDRSDNFEYEPNNGIKIPPYDPDRQDSSLMDLMKWFKSDKFKQSQDVRKLDKDKIFS